MISTISNLITPLGTLISATSPTLFPNKPFPIGEVTEIFPDFKSASHHFLIYHVDYYNFIDHTQQRKLWAKLSI